MGTSFVKYKGFGFWSRDSFLESWLKTMLVEMGKLPALEPWLESLMEHWRTQAIVDGGCMSLELDEFLTDNTRHAFLLSLAEGALGLSNPLGHRTGELFIDLLAGKLKTTDSSPIDYLGPAGAPG
jgi:hypothetical protein